jgi:glycosyltransferase involved in cell wall biosynthesis
MQVLNPMTSSTPITEVSSEKNLTIVMVGALPRDLNQVKGGVEAVILNLFAGFQQMPDVKIVHIAFTKETSSAQQVQFAENIVIHFLPFVIKYELADYFINDKALQQILRDEKPDLIHIQEITPHIIRFLKFPKDNIVVTQHGIMKEELKYASGLSQKLKCTFKAGVERFVFPVFRHIIFISRYNQKLYRSRPVHGVQIFNPVNPIFFSGDNRGPEKKNNLIYVGVLSRRKNIRIVVEALHILKQAGKVFHLDVIGGFKEDAYEREITSLIQEYDLTGQVTFHGWLKQQQIRDIYTSCPIFILPSLQETLPVSIGEAMALGKVVVATDVGAINEMFTDNVSGFLFRKNDRDDLVRVLNKLFDSEDLSLIGDRARQEAMQKFHPLLIAKKTINFYREVIKTTKEKA